nr:PH domain-containing protein [uncultured Psychroserpens sp.]
MEILDFSKPIRQSSKGILIIFALNTYKFIRRFFVIFIAFGLSLSKKKSFAFLSTNILLLIIVGILISLLVLAILKYWNFKFHLTNDEFHLSTGIINKDNTVIPKSKIQNVNIKQNFIQQLINVVSLNIETAGDDKAEIEINALDKPTALQIKKELFNTTNIVETESHEIKNVFFRVSPKRLLLEGLSQNHFKSFAIIASFVFGLYYEFKDYIIELELQEQIKKTIHLDEESIFTFIILNLVVILIGILISLLFSVIKTVITNFNLEVIENQKTIEISKGLFNKVLLSLTPSRIQNIIIKTNRIKTYFGLNTLSVKQAMVNAKQRKNFNIIALEKDQVYHLINKLLDNYANQIKAFKPSLYYKRILIVEMLFIAGIFNIPAFFIFGNSFWLINILFLIMSVLYMHFKYKKAYYKINDEYITIGSGFIDTVTVIFEIHKIQSIEMKQNIFQKRKQIRSLNISTASQEVTIPYIDENEAKIICDFLLFKVESQDRDWM